MVSHDRLWERRPEMHRMATLTFLATAVVLILEMVQPQSRVLVELHKLSDSLPGGLHPSMWLALAAGGLWFLARPSPSTSIGRSKGPSPRSTSPSEDRNSAHPPPANPADDSDWKEQVLEAIDAMTQAIFFIS